MSAKKQVSPLAVVLLTVGSVACIGLAYWSISNALAPPAIPVKAVSVVPTNISTPGRNVAQNNTVASDTTDHRSPVTHHTEEANLAQDADPFLTMEASQPVATAAPHPTAPVQGSVPTANAGPSFPGAGPSIFPASPLFGPPAQAAPGSVQATPAEKEREPELVGTFLGDRACAVFREEHGVQVVPIGKTYLGWKVRSVTHGAVTLEKGKRSLHLEVGYAQSPALTDS